MPSSLGAETNLKEKSDKVLSTTLVIETRNISNSLVIISVLYSHCFLSPLMMRKMAFGNFMVSAME